MKMKRFLALLIPVFFALLLAASSAAQNLNSAGGQAQSNCFAGKEIPQVEPGTGDHVYYFPKYEANNDEKLPDSLDERTSPLDSYRYNGLPPLWEEDHPYDLTKFFADRCNGQNTSSR